MSLRNLGGRGAPAFTFDQLYGIGGEGQERGGLGEGAKACRRYMTSSPPRGAGPVRRNTLPKPRKIFQGQSHVAQLLYSEPTRLSIPSGCPGQGVNRGHSLPSTWCLWIYNWIHGTRSSSHPDGCTAPDLLKYMIFEYIALNIGVRPPGVGDNERRPGHEANVLRVSTYQRVSVPEETPKASNWDPTSLRRPNRRTSVCYPAMLCSASQRSSRVEEDMAFSSDLTARFCVLFVEARLPVQARFRRYETIPARC
ncbi:hypothetical protein BV25DRAFT_1828885 [Artomyces pyxidatus]|uniref:Uncharacterized protein n=1 Tax=Artomyces pyxidatus TaxID=48021 RepID=A0ACB8SUY0_9AGAM|nr:hypothetical protein BV25DRAFT_1828885 [Artomyces pyxidatus]